MTRSHGLTLTIKLPFFQLLSLILITGKVWGRITFSWLVCLSPVIFEILVLFLLSLLTADSRRDQS
jgi:hypothetical protein